jgi:poly-gamma-glutamate system protein
MNGDRGKSARSRRSISVYLAASLSLLYLIFFDGLSRPGPSLRQDMSEASRWMSRATAAVRDCRSARRIPLDPVADPNGTGLIGLETSEITTSLGSLEAKRTTTNPNFAGLVVGLLHEAGVRKGDAVAVGASSSFPALIIATLCALKAVEAEPLVISSLGSSEWGANVPDFDWSDMEDCLRTTGIVDIPPLARALGGDEDVGRDMDPAGRALLESRIRAGGVPFLDEPDLARNVEARMRLYAAAAAERPVKAFVNIGGSWANIGTNAEVLKLRPGLTRDVFIPPPAERGVLQAMAARRVPVIHLLNVKGLCERYGLPWDPRPLPEPGRGGDRFYRDIAARTLPGAALTAVYIFGMCGVLLLGRRQGEESSERPIKARRSGSEPRL